MKNSDMFNLPLKFEAGDDGFEFKITDSNQSFIINLYKIKNKKSEYFIINIDQAEAIVRSINEHDKLKAELKKAKELLGNVIYPLKNADLIAEDIYNFLNKAEDIYNFLNKEDK